MYLLFPCMPTWFLIGKKKLVGDDDSRFGAVSSEGEPRRRGVASGPSRARKERTFVCAGLEKGGAQLHRRPARGPQGGAHQD